MCRPGTFQHTCLGSDWYAVEERWSTPMPDLTCLFNDARDSWAWRYYADCG